MGSFLIHRFRSSGMITRWMQYATVLYRLQKNGLEGRYMCIFQSTIKLINTKISIDSCFVV